MAAVAARSGGLPWSTSLDTAHLVGCYGAEGSTFAAHDGGSGLDVAWLPDEAPQAENSRHQDPMVVSPQQGQNGHRYLVDSLLQHVAAVRVALRDEAPTTSLSTAFQGYFASKAYADAENTLLQCTDNQGSSEAEMVMSQFRVLAPWYCHALSTLDVAEGGVLDWQTGLPASSASASLSLQWSPSAAALHRRRQSLRLLCEATHNQLSATPRRMARPHELPQSGTGQSSVVVDVCAQSWVTVVSGFEYTAAGIADEIRNAFRSPSHAAVSVVLVDSCGPVDASPLAHLCDRSATRHPIAVIVDAMLRHAIDGPDASQRPTLILVFDGVLTEKLSIAGQLDRASPSNFVEPEASAASRINLLLDFLCRVLLACNASSSATPAPKDTAERGPAPLCLPQVRIVLQGPPSLTSHDRIARYFESRLGTPVGDLLGPAPSRPGNTAERTQAGYGASVAQHDSARGQQFLSQVAASAAESDRHGLTLPRSVFPPLQDDTKATTKRSRTESADANGSDPSPSQQSSCPRTFTFRPFLDDPSRQVSVVSFPTLGNDQRGSLDSSAERIFEGIADCLVDLITDAEMDSTGDDAANTLAVTSCLVVLPDLASIVATIEAFRERFLPSAGSLITFVAFRLATDLIAAAALDETPSFLLGTGIDGLLPLTPSRDSVEKSPLTAVRPGEFVATVVLESEWHARAHHAYRDTTIMVHAGLVVTSERLRPCTPLVVLSVSRPTVFGDSAAGRSVVPVEPMTVSYEPASWCRVLRGASAIVAHRGEFTLRLRLPDMGRAWFRAHGEDDTVPTPVMPSSGPDISEEVNSAEALASSNVVNDLLALLHGLHRLRNHCLQFYWRRVIRVAGRLRIDVDGLAAPPASGCATELNASCYFSDFDAAARTEHEGLSTVAAPFLVFVARTLHAMQQNGMVRVGTSAASGGNAVVHLCDAGLVAGEGASALGPRGWMLARLVTAFVAWSDSSPRRDVPPLDRIVKPTAPGSAKVPLFDVFRTWSGNERGAFVVSRPARVGAVRPWLPLVVLCQHMVGLRLATTSIYTSLRRLFTFSLPSVSTTNLGNTRLSKPPSVRPSGPQRRRAILESCLVGLGFSTPSVVVPMLAQLDHEEAALSRYINVLASHVVTRLAEPVSDTISAAVERLVRQIAEGELLHFDIVAPLRPSSRSAGGPSAAIAMSAGLLQLVIAYASFPFVSLPPPDHLHDALPVRRRDQWAQEGSSLLTQLARTAFSSTTRMVCDNVLGGADARESLFSLPQDWPPEFLDALATQTRLHVLFLSDRALRQRVADYRDDENKVIAASSGARRWWPAAPLTLTNWARQSSVVGAAKGKDLKSDDVEERGEGGPLQSRLVAPSVPMQRERGDTPPPGDPRGQGRRPLHGRLISLDSFHTREGQLAHGDEAAACLCVIRVLDVDENVNKMSGAGAFVVSPQVASALIACKALWRTSIDYANREFVASGYRHWFQRRELPGSVPNSLLGPHLTRIMPIPTRITANELWESAVGLPVRWCHTVNSTAPAPVAMLVPPVQFNDDRGGGKFDEAAPLTMPRGRPGTGPTRTQNRLTKAPSAGAGAAAVAIPTRTTTLGVWLESPSVRGRFPIQSGCASDVVSSGFSIATLLAPEDRRAMQLMADVAAKRDAAASAIPAAVKTGASVNHVVLHGGVNVTGFTVSATSPLPPPDRAPVIQQVAAKLSSKGAPGAPERVKAEAKLLAAGGQAFDFIKAGHPYYPFFQFCASASLSSGQMIGR